MELRSSFCFIFAALFVIPVLGFRTYRKEDVLRLREEVREMFQHAYDGYLNYAGDYDELRPLSCDGVDTWGSYSLTLIDALDTLAVMGNFTEFRRVVDILTKKTNFDADINVSVFETNIRIVGGLLGAHLMSLRAGVELEPGWPCNGPLLSLAEDVAKRLLPAFDTKTGMPFGTVNLRHGVPSGETTVTCTAGVGTFIVEFGALSRLTGDPIYEEVALNALYALWKYRSPIGLFGNHIDVQTGRWTAQDAGIGAGVDSYYEYLVKGALMLNRPELLEMFHVGRKAIDKYLKRDDWHVWVSMNKGQVTLPVFQSLEAYWPGVLSLIGDIAPAMKTLHNYHSVWKQYGFLPEFYNIPSAEAGANRENYPLRPELIESVMYLYRATSDPYLLEVGEDMLRSIQYSAKTTCGYATIKNVRDHRKEDRMESFFLAETTKYLYLLFDPDNFLHNDGREGTLHETPNGVCVIHAGGYIFNTEAHPIDPSALRCCHDNSDWFNDFKVEKFLGDELKRRDEKHTTPGCASEQTQNIPNTENLTIDIETTVDSDETRQKMIAEILGILKTIENETAAEDRKGIKVDAARKEAQKKNEIEKSLVENTLKEAIAASQAFENIISSLNDQFLAGVNERMTKLMRMIDFLDAVVENYLQKKNLTAEKVLSKSNPALLEITIETDKKMVDIYDNLAYHMFLIEIFQSLMDMQSQHLENNPQNIADSAVQVLQSLQKGIGEAVLKKICPELMDIFEKAQVNYEMFLAKKNLSLDMYSYALQLSSFSFERDIDKLINFLHTVKEKKRIFAQQFNSNARGPLNLKYFIRVYRLILEIHQSTVGLRVDENRSLAQILNSENDEIMLVRRDSPHMTPSAKASRESSSESLDNEPIVGKGSVEQLNLGHDASMARPSMKMKEEPIIEKTENVSADEKAKQPIIRPPEIQQNIDESTNNSLLTDFVQTILKSTLPAKPKFEPQLLLEKIRENGIYNNQEQNFELLTCRAQPFLQRVSINGEFF